VLLVAPLGSCCSSKVVGLCVHGGGRLQAEVLSSL